MPRGNGIIAPANPRPYAPPPKVVVGPQNVGLPGYRPGDPNPGGGAGAVPNPVVAVIAPPPPAPPPAPAAPPPPPDFNALATLDPEYTLGSGELKRHHDQNVADLLTNWMRSSQNIQDSANAHGALFSGAAANAIANRANDYHEAGTRENLDWNAADAKLKIDVKNRIIQQYLGGMTTNG